MSTKHLIQVEMTVNVEVDKSKFNKQFMQEFRESFYDFHTLEDHTTHLAQLYARGLASNSSFIEGYGPAKDMGIWFEPVSQEMKRIKP